MGSYQDYEEVEQFYDDWQTQLLIDDANHLGGEYYPNSWHQDEGEITPEDQDSHEYYQEHFKAERGL